MTSLTMMRRVLALILLAALLATGVTVAAAAQNPFISSKQNKTEPQKQPLAGYPAFLSPIMNKILIYQQIIKNEMVGLAKTIQKQPFGRAFWGFMLLSFAYGVVHAMGPGHGKIYTCSYFLSQPGTLKKVLLFGNMTMLIHVLSGTLLILFGALVLKTSGAMTLENSGIYLERFSYGILVVVGLFIGGKIIREIRSGHGHRHDCPERGNVKSLVVTALAVGMVPCPGAALILLFALTLNILGAGLWAMLCIAAGMAITTSLFALGAMGFRKTFLSLATHNSRLGMGIYGALSIGGAMCISTLGFILLLGSF